jgi:hypothetical protein
MKPNPLCLLLLPLLSPLGCSDARARADQPIAAFQDELLELAFRAACAFPIDPHIKSRCRAQDEVVAACLQLDQPQRALRFAEQIGNWRRGTAFADLAFYCAKRGDVGDVRHHLERAARVADEVGADPSEQTWRRDRIRAKIASVHALLGETERARQLTTDLASSEIGRVGAAAAKTLGAELLNARIEGLRADFATGDFELSRNALGTCAELFDRCYADGQRRARLGAMVKTADKVPDDLRIDAIARMSEAALRHEDPDQARALVADARKLLDGTHWITEHFMPMAARLAALRHRAGEPQRGRLEADQALARYHERRAEIVDIHRAGALRPLAEAYRAMGDTGAALTVYRLAVEEGVENSNSRPRADDLIATCCSMARHGVEPDAALRARLISICDGLAEPW